MNQENDEQGFTISDKRFSAKKEPGGPPEKGNAEEEPLIVTPGGEKTETRGDHAEKEGVEYEPVIVTPGGEKAEFKGKQAVDGDTTREKQEMPAINFVTFIFSLCNTALVHLGEMSVNEGDAPQPNLPLARQTIDILDMLKEKTKGNLDNEEELLLDDLLYDLRMRYIKISDK